MWVVYGLLWLISSAAMAWVFHCIACPSPAEQRADDEAQWSWLQKPDP